MRIEVRWTDAGGQSHEASFPCVGPARAFAGGLTDLGLPWGAYKVTPFDFEDVGEVGLGRDVPAILAEAEALGKVVTRCLHF